MMLKKIEYFGRKLLYEPETQDLSIIKEQPRSYGYLFDAVPKPKTVLDFGANRGYFAAYAYSRGAKKVISVEPEPTNISIFKRNVPEAKLYEAAAGLEPDQGTLYIAGGSNKGIHGLIPKRGRKEMQVKILSFWNLIEKHQPAIVKIDIEETEYLLEIDKRLFPTCVRALAIEFGIRDYVNAETKKLILGHATPNQLVSDNIFYKTYQAIRTQFPIAGKDTTAGLTKLNWGAIYSGSR